MTKVIHHEFSFNHPPEKVWEYLTKPELMEQWLMKSNFLPIIGYDFEFRTNPYPALDFDGVIYCKVLEIIPFKKLSYSWKSGPGDGKITLDSLVVWSLETKDNGTALTLDHSGFAELENFKMFTGLNDGWVQNIKKMTVRLNTATNDATIS